MMAQEQRLETVQQPAATAVMAPALKVGAACGCAGFLFGGASGTLRGTTPGLFATAASIQTFALGTTFWACRSTIVHTGLATDQRPYRLIQVSSLAGGISGGVIAFLTRGRRNVLPATLMWSLTAGLGQLGYNRYTSEHMGRQATTPENLWTNLAKRSWFPMKVLSSEEYAEMLREKMLKVDVEIALLDDRIAALSQQQQVDRCAAHEDSHADPSS